MKLAQVWNSAGAWGAVSALKKNPKLAYRLMKYEKKVAAEMMVMEEHRRNVIYDVAGVPRPAPGELLLVDVSGDTEKMAEINRRFNEFAQQDSDLPWVGITLDEVIDGLADETGKGLSENEIEALEPFFTKPEEKPAHLKLVENGAPEAEAAPPQP